MVLNYPKYCFPVLRLFLCLAAVLLFSSRAAAVEEPYMNELKGADVAAGKSFTVADEKFGNASAWSSVYHTVSVNNLISFEINFDTSLYFYNQPFTAAVNFKVYIYGNPSDTSEVTDSLLHGNVSLDLRYDTATGKAYKGIALYKFKGAHKFRVKIVSITSPQFSPVPAIFRLKGQVIVDRQYNFSDTPNDVTRFAILPGNQLRLQWTPSGYPGAEMFDIEYTHIDDSSRIAAAIRDNYVTGAAEYTVPSDTLDKWFRNNASRVTTTSSSYLLDIPYSSGYILFRIRGAMVHYADGIRWEGSWNYRATRLPSCSGGCPGSVLYILGHEPDLNWQYSVSFAEEGKTKKVMSYFDALLYTRQLVTLSNTEKKSIVQETIYDALGRPSLNILPVPAPDSTLHYFRNFNRNASGAPYSFSDFSAAAHCTTNAQPMSDLSGAARYYSDKNSFLNDFYYARYIPRADSFPFTVTEYIADNSGRVSMQGGLGRDFQINSGHETKYFYGKPSQTELDRMFGSEAGNATHYLKNMVVDPNGQISVSYLEPGGKTVATALAGAVPANLHALPSSEGASTIVKDDLIKPESFDRNGSSYSLTASATFLAPVTGNYLLDYKVDPLKLVLFYGALKDSQICNTCYYDLDIIVKDNCDNTIRQETRPAGAVFDTSCTASLLLQDTIGVQISKIGEYYVTYSLRISRDALDYYDSVHLAKNSDIRKFNSFLLDELKETDFTGCYNNCETCLDDLGTKEEFFDKFRLLYTTDSVYFGAADSLYTLSLYDSLLSHCWSLQSDCREAVCDEKLAMLKIDVSPGGQYALYDSAFNLLELPINVLAKRSEILSFPDGFGGMDSVTLVNEAGEDSIRVAVQDIESDSVFIANWKDAWADSLVRLHPEYCYYLWCVANSSSYEYDREIENWEDADTAMLKGWFDPADHKALLDKDPFFNTFNGVTGLGAPLYARMQDSLALFSRTMVRFAQSDKNILQTIDIVLYCNQQANGWDACSPDSACRSRNREWFLYKHLYLNLKQRFYEEARRTTGGFENCVNCHVGGDLLDNISLSCPEPEDFEILRSGGGDYVQDENGNFYLPDNATVRYKGGSAFVRKRTVVTFGFYPGCPTVPEMEWTVTFEPGDNIKTLPFRNYNMECAIVVKSVSCADSVFTPFVDSTCNYSCPGGVYDPYDRENLSFYIEYGSPQGGAANVPAGYSNCQFYPVFDLKTGASASCRFYNVWVCVYDSSCAPACTPVSSLSISARTTTSISYTWNSVTGAGSYLWRITNTANPGVTVQSGTAFGTSLTVTGLSNQSSYKFEIKVNCEDGTTGWTGLTCTTKSPAATIGFTCSDHSCTQQGSVGLNFNFQQPTAQAMTLYFGEITWSAGAGYRATGYDLFTLPSGVQANTYYGQVGNNVPFKVDIPAGVTSYTVAAPIYQVGYVPPTTGTTPWICHNCIFPIKDLYLKIQSPSNIQRDFTLTNSGVTLHNLSPESGSGEACTELTYDPAGESGLSCDTSSTSYPSSCPDPTEEGLFKNKIRRYPEYVNGSDFINSVLNGNPQQASEEAETQIAEECRSNCEAQADYWISALGRCTTDSTKLAELKAALIDVCSRSCTPASVFGSSTVGSYARIQAESYASMSGIGIEATGDTGGGNNVAWIETGDWMDYAVTVPSAGLHTVSLRVACGQYHQQAAIKNASGTVLAVVNIPFTAGWQTYQTVSVKLNLPQGNQTLRIEALTSGGWNFNWLEIKGGATLRRTVPARIEAEDYDDMSGVEIETTGDPEGGNMNASWLDNGDWMDYKVKVAAAGAYNIRLRIACPSAFQQLLIKKGDGTLLAAVTMPSTGWWQTYTTINTTVNLAAGDETIRIESATNVGFNFNWMELSPVADLKVEAEDYTAMNGIFTENTQDAGGGLNVGWQDDNDWMDYSVSLPETGVYTVKFRVATQNTGAQFQLRDAQGNVLATMNVPNTSWWQSWQTISTELPLQAGTQTLRIFTNNSAGGWNLNWIEFSRYAALNPAPYFSFEEAIKGVLGPNAINDSCALELLSNPYPRDRQPFVAERTIHQTDYDICRKIGAYRSEWQSSGFAGSFHGYLIQKIGIGYGLDSTELDDLVNSCTNCNGILKNNVSLPIAFEPGARPCLSCAEVQLAFTDFTAKFPNLVDSVSADYEVMFTNFFNHRFGFSLSYDEYRAFLQNCGPASSLCDHAAQPEFTTDAANECMADLFATALTNAQNSYLVYIDSVRREFRNAYMTRCMNVQPSLTMQAELFEYHYTLYYYDQSSNLVKTVPPEGVKLLNEQELAGVRLYRLFQNESCYQYSDSILLNNDGYVSFPSVPSSGLHDFSLESRVNLKSHADQVLFSQLLELPSGDTLNTYVHKGFLVSLSGNKLKLEVYGAEYVDTLGYYVQRKATAVSLRDASALIPANGWRHLVLGFEYGNLAAPWTVHIDGNPAALNYTQNTLKYPLDNYAYHLVIGAHLAANLPAQDRLRGSVKNLRMYNRILPIGEIRQNAYNDCQLFASDRQLVFWAPLTDAANNEVRDRVYGLAGNLVGPSWQAFTGVYNDHFLATTYHYNSLNQVVQQYSPDGDTSQFWYDRLGRLTASQTREQKEKASYSGTANRFSYTKYDALGRMKEVGEKSNPLSDIRNINMLDSTAVKNWVASGSDRQVTRTIYDEPVNALQQAGTSRKRVSASIYLENPADAEGDSTIFVYDISGNVKTLLQHVKALVAADGANGKKRLDYDYDLVSGKTNKVSYQHGKGDQFYYKYLYDADNRVVRSLTSRDQLVWTEEASYNYYLHGPLARTELGRWKVQGLDYAYTLQGWLKGINSDVLDASKDMGNDGISGSPYGRVSRDVFGFKLGYFNNDYKPVGGSGAPAFGQANYWAPGSLAETGNPLFNGNISYTTQALSKIGSGATTGYSYGYDQLNRLREMRQHTVSGSWSNTNIITAYSESIMYDANGNIMEYKRNGANTPGHPLQMDNLTYKYNTAGVTGRLMNNRLNHVADDVNSSNYATDIDDQEVDNYKYDYTGNLVSDAAEGIDTIRWNLYGKINRIVKGAAGTVIDYSYDPGGNRTVKKVAAQDTVITTYYVRDAQGNVMGIYSKKDAAPLTWDEQDIYGSSRIGVWRWDTTVPQAPPVVGSNNHLYDSLLIGSRSYEITNHLGNVVSIISDKKIGNDSSGVVNYYIAEVLSQNDYYPFGMQMPQRKFNAGSGYRYGFNGHEKSDEIKGKAQSYTAQFWEYDPRLGRRWNLDPKPIFGISEYSAFANNPNWYVDLKGDTLRGVNSSSASTQLSIAQNTFKDHKDIQGLFKLNSDGVTFAAIDKTEFDNAILNKDIDVQNAAIGLYESINNKATQYVSYITSSDLPNKDLSTVAGLSPAIVTAVNTQAPTLADLNTNFGGAMNLAIAGKQSLSIINTSSSFSPNDIYNEKGKRVSFAIPLGAVFFHEVLGHGLGGILNTTDQRHKDAIQLENVYYRVMGIKVQRSGSDHPPVATKLSAQDQSNVPAYIQGKRLFTMEGMKYDYEPDILKY